MSAATNLLAPQLRPMRDADLSQVLNVEQLSYEFPWTLGIFRDCMRVGYHCHVFEGPSGVVGHGVMSIAAGECHLLNICVHPDWQRRGLGRQLVVFMLDIARQHHVRTALLEVRVSNTVAHRLYASLGFNEVGTRHNYYPGRQGREDAIILARELLPH
ncbi:MAG TPA: ribosomal protein S18-alanine N-acetyltransferase [Burkholderiaceae bacterium]|nr:ribosomal protein S18-alanine N-acetyltransferase [Burkholderiaceae bacterium]